MSHINETATAIQITHSTSFTNPAPAVSPDVIGIVLGSSYAHPNPNLVFAQQPGSAITGQAFGLQPVIEVRHINGRLATTFSGNVTIALTSAFGATLSGTLTVAVVNGVAKFTNLSINLAASYSLTATATGANNGVSNNFSVSAAPPGPATQVVVTTGPSGVVAGSAFSMSVAAEDVSNVIATSYSGTATVTIATGSGVLSGTTSASFSSGTLTFSNLVLSAAGAYTLTISSGSLTSATTSSFTVTAVSLTVSPTTWNPSANVGASVVTQTVTVTTAGTWTASTTSTGISLSGATGTGNGSFVATFTPAGSAGTSSIDISVSETGATTQHITGTATTTTSGYSLGTATHLHWFTQPGGAVAGATLSPQPVGQAQDGANATATGFTYPMQLAIKAGTGTSGAILGGTNPKAPSSGITTWSDITIDRAGTGYVLTLSAPGSGLASVDSSTFTITGGTTTYFNDTFTDTNGVYLASHTPDTGTGWTNCTATTGQPTIQSNTAQVGTSTNSAFAGATSAVSDCVIRYTHQGGGNECGVNFRSSSNSSIANCWQLQSNSASGSRLIKFTGGSASVVATGATLSNGDAIVITLSGSAITITRNGSAFLSTTDSYLSTSTNHGIYLNAAVANGSAVDSYSIKSA